MGGAGSVGGVPLATVWDNGHRRHPVRHLPGVFPDHADTGLAGGVN